MIDGPALRALRESKGVSLRKVAQLGGFKSHGHLSKVERGEDGRPVTPAVLRGYEEATGVKLTGGELPAGDNGWRAGQLSPQGRRTYVGHVGAVALGGPPPAPVHHVVDNHRRAVESGPIDPAALEAIVGTLEALGPGAGAMAFVVLRLAVRHDTDPAAVARLARVATAGALATGRYDTARALDLVGLHAAVTADDPDLRAFALAGIAALLLRFDAPGDALAVVRLAEADERVGDDGRKVLDLIRAEVGEVEQRVRDAIAGP